MNILSETSRKFIESLKNCYENWGKSDETQENLT